jgi:hypothetical protein
VKTAICCCKQETAKAWSPAKQQHHPKKERKKEWKNLGPKTTSQNSQPFKSGPFILGISNPDPDPTTFDHGWDRMDAASTGKYFFIVLLYRCFIMVVS